MNSVLLKTIERHERILHSRAARVAEERLRELIAPEFVEFGSSGTCYTRSDILQLLPDHRPLEIEMLDTEVTALGVDHALITYRASIFSSDSVPKHSLRSSIWRREGDRWVIIFHQGTVTQP